MCQKYINIRYFNMYFDEYAQNINEYFILY